MFADDTVGTRLWKLYTVAKSMGTIGLDEWDRQSGPLLVSMLQGQHDFELQLRIAVKHMLIVCANENWENNKHRRDDAMAELKELMPEN